MKKILLATVMCAVFSFAGDSTDLLALATGGEAKGASYELNTNEMQSVEGGKYVFERRLISGNSTTSIGMITEGYNGMLAKLYAKKIDGSVSLWITASSSGLASTYTKVGTTAESTRLIALYKSQAISSLKL